jgi:hypothetical protein
MSSETSEDKERNTMLCHTNLEAERIMIEMTYGLDDQRRRRSMLRLIGRTDGR